MAFKKSCRKMLAKSSKIESCVDIFGSNRSPRRGNVVCLCVHACEAWGVLGQAIKQENKHASKQARKKDSKQADKQTSKQTSK